MLQKLRKLLIFICRFREEPMIPDDHEEVNLSEFDPDAERRSHQHSGYDDDDEGQGHGPGVSCATQ